VKKAKLLCLLLALAMLISACLVGCTKPAETPESSHAAEATPPEEATAEPAIDTSEAVELTGYLLGAPPAGFDAMMEKLNEKLSADINATMTINYIGWADLEAKYPLVLAAGEDVDWIYTANWAYYFQEAAKGAFYELTPEMLQTYAPRYWAAQNEVAYAQATVNGSIYMLPTVSPDKKVPVAVIRGDLRKKYGLPEITNFADIEPYLAAVKENEEGMYPMYLDSSYDLDKPYTYLEASGCTDILFSTGSGTGLFFDIEEDSGQLHYLFDEPYFAGFKAAADIVKSWYDKGYINQDVISNPDRSKDTFGEGKTAVAFGNSQDIQGTLLAAADKGWETEIIPGVSKAGHYLADPFINNGAAIAANSQHPERTLMFLDLIMEEPSYNYLVYFGIEGENYVEKDGKIDLPEGVTNETNTYPPDAAGFWFTDKNQHLPLATWPDQYVAFRTEITDMGYLKPHPLAAMPIDTEPVKTEVANVNQVMIQYYQPIRAGMVDDVDAAFTMLDEQLKAAGVETLQTEFQAQVDAYLGGIQ
jgi:putative aldouronate transport system substrate-binding protein